MGKKPVNPGFLPKKKYDFSCGKKSFYAYFVPYGRKFAVISCDLVTEGMVGKGLY